MEVRPPASRRDEADPVHGGRLRRLRTQALTGGGRNGVVPSDDDAEPARREDPLVSAAVVTGAGSALPATIDQSAVWDGYFARHYAGVPAARRIFAGAGVRRRHAVASPLDEDLSQWGTGARMVRYVQEALPLGKQAVAGALDAAGLAPGDVGLFAVATCTGYATPGLDIRLAGDLGMPAGLQRLLVGHMGCYAAVPGLAAISDFVTARSRPAVLLCCELTSLHVQPAQADLEQVVAHALFSDAAAAVVVEPGAARGRRMAGIVARTDASTADHMTWDVTDLGFRMGLSPRVPDVLAKHVGDVVDELVTGAGIRVEDVGGWAVHPGGPRILDVVRDELGLTEPQMGASRRVLAEHGNCSSATVLLVLEELADVDGPVVAMAFGPGLTLYAALLLPS
jgi:alkylresorcinol/alkylpyrone synthase